MERAVGFSVTYHPDAFITSDSTPLPTPERLSKALDCASGFVRGYSFGINDKPWSRWNITREHRSSANDTTVKVTVWVPSGSDQREQLFAALHHFEKELAEQLGAPIATELRTIEEEKPKCTTCKLSAVWVRITQSGNERYFCDLHAQQEPDFDDSEPLSYPSWMRLNPINIY